MNDAEWEKMLYAAITDDVIQDQLNDYEKLESKVWYLEHENAKLRELLADCHALLQRCCDAEDEHGCDCPMWPDRGEDCDLRKVERSMRELGIGVDCGAANGQVPDAIYGRYAGEIVRCKDCKHYSDHKWVIWTDVSDVCDFWHGEPTKVAPDGFCAWGERKDER